MTIAPTGPVPPSEWEQAWRERPALLARIEALRMALHEIATNWAPAEWLNRHAQHALEADDAVAKETK